MNVIALSPWDLILAAGLVLLLAVLATRLRLGVSRQLVVNGIRMTIQLLLIGLVLDVIFGHTKLHWIALMAFVMLAVAGREVMARQRRRFTGWWGYGMGALSMFVSSFAVAILSLTVIVAPEPWYQPQYAIPLLGMLLGNTMNGIALSLDRLTQSTWQQRAAIESRLMLGQTRQEAMGGIMRDSMRSALTPTINAMAAAGIVSLPGMMTGQILAGASPIEAVKYQILIMFLIACGAGFGSMAAIWIAGKRLFDSRHRLRLDHLQPPRSG